MHQAPSRGALAGIKEDLQKSKEGYNPNGVGNAYSHNFLNQKPWHPANFKNQARVYEAQQAKLAEEKRKQQAKAEFAAEQEYLQTLSYLGPEEEKRYRERQGVQFMYMKPPGAGEDPLVKTQVKELPVEEAKERMGDKRRHWQEPRESHVGNMLGAMRALQNHDKWTVKHVTGTGSSPARGAVGDDPENQQYVLSSPDPDSSSLGEEDPKRKRRKLKDERLNAAREVLRRANIDAESTVMSKHPSHDKKKSKKSKTKKRKRHKERSHDG